MGPGSVLDLYWLRLRARLAQECFALVGIAAGVALLFAAEISSRSLGNSVGELSHGIAGRATLQMLARDPHGFPENMLGQVRRIPGVTLAAPVVEADAGASGPKGSATVQLVGADGSLKELDGQLVRHTNLEPFGGVGALALPAVLAKQLGTTRFAAHVTFQIAGRDVKAPLYEVLSRRRIGGLVSAPVALAPLAYAQEITGLEHRLSRILVQPAHGSERKVRHALVDLAAGRLNVVPVGYENSLFAEAAQASNQSTTLFATVSALIGFLLAFNAMLLTVPQRRKLATDLRRDGYTPSALTAVLLSDAIALGALACLIGLVLGDLLSIYALHSNPAFLSLAFTLGGQRSLSWQAAAIACTAGMSAAVMSVLVPLREVLSGRSLTAGVDKPRLHTGIDPALTAALTGVACLLAASLILRANPGAAIPAMTLLLAALVLVLPLTLRALLAAAGRLADLVRSAVPHLAVAELRASGPRAVAIAATGAVAVFGSVTIAGAHHDLLAGLERTTRETNSSSAVWIHPQGSYDLLDTTPFPPTQQSTIEHLDGVSAVGLYRGGLLDWGTRRVLVSAPPVDAPSLLPATQIVQGNDSSAEASLRQGGSVILSRAIADEHHLRIGQTVTLPTPHPVGLRLAALSTNLGWAPGAVILNSSDYARAWNSEDITAYGVRLDRGTTPQIAARRIAAALQHQAGLAVETSARHTAGRDTVSRQALARLSQVATMIPIAAVLAIVAALAAMIWQTRPHLARLILEGLPRGVLLRSILLEGALLAGTGGLTGAMFGIYGKTLVDRALSSTINFPVYHATPLTPTLAALALLTVPTLAMLSLPAHITTRRITPALALAD